jgi:hypothetical protein
VIQLDKGQAVTFASNIRHGGHKVTAGALLAADMLYLLLTCFTASNIRHGGHKVTPGLCSILVGSKACQQQVKQVKQVGVLVYEA